MPTPIKTTLLVTAMTLGLTTAARADHMAFALGDNGNTLVSFAPDGSGTATGVSLYGEDLPSLDAITFRPETGELYGFSSDDDTFYLIDPFTGSTSAVFTSDIDVTTTVASLDFNPTLDAVRLITDAGDNLVYNPNAGTITRVTDLSYDEGYPSELNEPTPTGNAYTNQIGFDAAQETGTTQYVLDSQTDTIGILNNNAGDIDFTADLGVDFTETGGFDIFTDGDGNNTAYALLTTVDGQGFYEIDLGTFALMPLFMPTEEFGVLSDLAVFVPSAIPVPAAGLLFLTGAGGIAAMRRRKAQA